MLIYLMKCKCQYYKLKSTKSGIRTRILISIKKEKKNTNKPYQIEIKESFTIIIIWMISCKELIIWKVSKYSLLFFITKTINNTWPQAYIFNNNYYYWMIIILLVQVIVVPSMMSLHLIVLMRRFESWLQSLPQWLYM